MPTKDLDLLSKINFFVFLKKYLAQIQKSVQDVLTDKEKILKPENVKKRLVARKQVAKKQKKPVIKLRVQKEIIK